MERDAAVKSTSGQVCPAILLAQLSPAKVSVNI